MSEIIKIEETDSTNQLLKDLCDRQILPEGAALFARFQTAGRGQHENRWVADAGKNILGSMVVYPRFLPVKQQFLLSEAVAVGLRDVLQKYIRPVEIKWPNDIYFQDKKLAGILIENELSGHIIDKSIIGVGINVNQEHFPPTAPNAISIKQITGSDADLNALPEQIVAAILSRYDSLKTGDSTPIVAAYHDALYRKSGVHLFEDRHGRFAAEIIRVGDDGRLYLAAEEGMRSYAFKEIRHVLDN